MNAAQHQVASSLWWILAELSLVYLGTKMNWLCIGVNRSKVKVTITVEASGTSHCRRVQLSSSLQYNINHVSIWSSVLVDFTLYSDLEVHVMKWSVEVLILSTVCSKCYCGCDCESIKLFFCDTQYYYTILLTFVAWGPAGKNKSSENGEKAAKPSSKGKVSDMFISYACMLGTFFCASVEDSFIIIEMMFVIYVH